MGEKEDDDVDGFAVDTRIYSAVPLPLTQDGGPMGRIQVEPLPEIIKARLEALEGPQKGKRWKITKPLMIIGRVAEVADVVLEDAAASRHHAAIAHQDGQFVLYDMGSTNGTFMGGHAVDREKLTHGSQFRIGATLLAFRID